MSGKKEEYFEGLRKKLTEEGGFPKVYLYKFIVPSDNKSLALVESLFGDEAQVSIRTSKTGKYISVSAKEVMLSVDNIIKRYEDALNIEGCVAL
ncbi:MAG: hypothetical protein CL840_05310 [Crocinitomicaceae bacterium]|nr:hypothetical protein [Crocinitomicaceae bacterium]|tara:strand:+ start:2862 stop:3143 length:282 start_codon:yes stop_codon:yes gene_type:complete